MYLLHASVELNDICSSFPRKKVRNAGFLVVSELAFVSHFIREIHSSFFVKLKGQGLPVSEGHPLCPADDGTMASDGREWKPVNH